MSRTYRKCEYTSEKTKVQYVNREIARLPVTYDYHRELRPHDEVAYEQDILQYKKDYSVFVNSGYQPFYKCPGQPRLYDYYTVTYTPREYDIDKEIAKAEAEYDSYSRDDYWRNTSRNSQFKKYCAKDLRHKNKNVLTKIMKDDESWEMKPFPDTYLGKQFIWDFF